MEWGCIGFGWGGGYLNTYFESIDDVVVTATEAPDEEVDNGVVVVVFPVISILDPEEVGRSLTLSTIFFAGLPLLDIFFPGNGLSSDLGVLVLVGSFSSSSSDIYLNFPVFKLRDPIFPMYPSRSINPLL